ncbi:MAG: hypothetical protein LBN95_00340 [Prevotellaceae bacterium]|jgi:Spy/CpxP family protein refolding chaperone|nr:hypothetical protein [Prevotellaceae bacterium]
MKKYLFTPLLFCFAIVSFAQNNQKQTAEKAKLAADRTEFFTQRIGLTAEQSPYFWEIYNTYKADDSKLLLQERDLRKKCLENKLSDEEYNQSLEKLLQVDKDRYELRVKFYKKIDGFLTPKQKILLYDTVKQYRNHLLKKINTKKND